MPQTEMACHDLYIRHFSLFCKECLNIIYFLNVLYNHNRSGEFAFQPTDIFVVLSVRTHGTVPPFSDLPLWGV
jgi:hypothetical protein